jgi:hypothetical protein
VLALQEVLRPAPVGIRLVADENHQQGEMDDRRHQETLALAETLQALPSSVGSTD